MFPQTSLGVTSALQHLQLNYASCNVKVDSLTFISLQQNYQIAKIYHYHVIPLNSVSRGFG